LVKPSSGLSILLAFAAVLLFVIWSARSHQATISANVGLLLIRLGISSDVAGSSWMPEVGLEALELYAVPLRSASDRHWRARRAGHLAMDTPTMLRALSSGTLRPCHRFGGVGRNPILAPRKSRYPTCEICGSAPVRFALPAQPVDATPSSALTRQCLRRRSIRLAVLGQKRAGVAFRLV